MVKSDPSELRVWVRARIDLVRDQVQDQVQDQAVGQGQGQGQDQGRNKGQGLDGQRTSQTSLQQPPSAVPTCVNGVAA